MVDCYKSVLQKYAVFHGRARRREYWSFALVNFLVMVGLALVAGAFGGAGRQATAAGSLFTVVYLLYVLAIIVPSIAVSVRRLHDVGKSGWWIFISFVPLIGAIWLLILYVTAGQAGANQFGPDPKTESNALNPLQA